MKSLLSAVLIVLSVNSSLLGQNSNIKQYRPVGKMFGESYQDTMLNFQLTWGSLDIETLGDINGDGKNDLFYPTSAQYLSSNDPSQLGFKTVVFFGEDFSDTPDLVLYGNYRAAGDLDGNGYDDMLRASSKTDYFDTIVFNSSEGMISVPIPDSIQIISWRNDYQTFIDVAHSHNDDIIYISFNSLGIISFEDGQFVSSEYNLQEILGFRVNDINISTVNVDDDASDELLISYVSDDVEMSNSYYLGASIFDIENDDLVRMKQWVFDRSLSIEQIYWSTQSIRKKLLPLKKSQLGDSLLVSLYDDNIYSFSFGQYFFDNRILSLPLNGDSIDTLSTSLSVFGSHEPIGFWDQDEWLDFFNFKDHTISSWVNGELRTLSTVIPNDFDTTSWAFPGLFWSNRTRPFGTFGDLNGDGLDDLVHSFVNRERLEYGFGYSATNILVNSVGNMETYYSTDFSQKQKLQVLATQNIGDMNSDGVDDLLLMIRDQSKNSALPFVANRLDINFGGENVYQNNTPTIVIDSMFQSFSNPTHADVNGDGFSDLIVPVFSNKYTEYRKPVLNIYHGSSQIEEFTVGQSVELPLEFSSDQFWIPADSKPILVKGLGDINNDGYEDIGVSFDAFSQSSSQVPLDQPISYVLLGSNSMSFANRLFIPSQLINENVINYEKIGDVNNDNIDDLAVVFGVSDVIFDEDFNPSVINGEVHIFHGSESLSEILNDPVQLFRSPYLLSGENNSTDNFGFGFTASKSNDSELEYIFTPVSRTVTNPAPKDPSQYAMLFRPSKLDSIVIEDFVTRSILTKFLNDSFAENDSSFLTSQISEFSNVGDVNGDGWDDLFLSFQSMSDALLFVSDGENHIDAMNSEPIRIVNSSPVGLLRSNGYHYESYAGVHSAVGDFDGNGSTELVIPSSDYISFISNPIFIYDLNGTGTSIENDEKVENFALFQNYPNPFNPTTTISFSVPSNQNSVSLEIFNVIGQKVMTLIDNKSLSAGIHSRVLDASGLASGIYLYRLTTDSFSQTQRMTLIK